MNDDIIRLVVGFALGVLIMTVPKKHKLGVIVCTVVVVAFDIINNGKGDFHEIISLLSD